MTDIQKQMAEALEHALHVMKATIRDRKNVSDLQSAIDIGQAALAAHRQQEAREPLTEEQVKEMAEAIWIYSSERHLAFARAIEAAHGIKGE